MEFKVLAKRGLLKFLKITGWIVLSIVALLLVVIMAIQIPSVQNRIVKETVGFVEKKIGTPVALNHFSLRFPKKIVLQGLYLQDQSKDTLLYAGEISVDTDIWGLLHHKIQLNNVDLINITAKISRTKSDSLFNYSYIVSAFAGDTTKVQKDTTGQVPWKFSLYGIDVESTHLRYHDSYSGNNADLDIGNLEVDIDDFDLDHSVFNIDDITVENTTAKITQTKMPEVAITKVPEPETDSTQSLSIDFNEINLENIAANYTQEAIGRIVQFNLVRALIEANKIDLISQKIDLEKFSVEKAFIMYRQMASPVAKKTPTIADTVEVPTPDDPWLISLAELDLSENTFQYHDFNKPMQNKSVDFNHLWISRFNTQANDLILNGSQIEGVLEDLSFREKSGFGIKSFQANFKVDNNSADINNFVFQTELSKLALNIHANFQSFETLASSYQDADIKFNITPSYVSVKDVLYFNREVLDSLPINLNPSTRLLFETSMSGQVADLNIQHIKLQTLTKTLLQAHGTIRGLPQMDKALMQVTLDKFYTTIKDIKNILPPSMIPQSIQIPDWINLAGYFKGTLKTPEVHSVLTTSIGSVVLKGSMNLDSLSAKQGYDGNVIVHNLHVGKLLKQEKTIGEINLTAAVKGKGFTMDKLTALLDLNIQDFKYNDYTYKDFSLNGSMNKYFFSGAALLQDKNLDFNLKADLDYNENVPTYKLKFELKNADFKALNLALRPLRARGTLDVDLATADFKVLNGTVGLRKVAIFNGEKLYAVDSLLFASIEQKGQTDISINSDIVNASFKGTINLFSLGDVMKRYVNTYFSMQDAAYEKPIEPQNFKFRLDLKKTDLITDILLPDLTSFEPGPIIGEFNSLNNDLYVRVSMGKIQYTNMATDSLLININSDKQKLNYNLFLQNVRVDSMLIYGVEFDGSVANDSIKTIFAIRDSLQEHRYRFGGVLSSLEKGFEFRFLKNMILLNYDAWNVPRDNYIRFGNGIVTRNLFLTKNEEKILIESKNDKDSTLSIGFRELDLADLAGMVTGTQLMVKGKLSGDVNLLMAKDNAFDAKVNISNLNIFEKAWGHVAVKVNRATADRFDVKLSIAGDNTDIQTNGYYAVTPTTSSINLTTKIQKLNLSILEPLTAGQTKDMKGMLTGLINVTGDLKKPTVLGGLIFKDAQFTSTYVNSQFTLKNETISFAEPGIVFDNFKIRDVDNNVASIDGSVNTTSFTDLKFDLGLKTRNFRVLNTTANDNELFYGKVGLNTRAHITGSSSLPVIDVQIGLSDDSQITYVVPQEEKAVMDQEGIVKFIDRDALKDPFLSSINPKDTVTKKFTGFDLTANIELSDKEIFNIIIDPATGDKLSVQGNTTLSLRMDPMGNMDLSGRYEISKGTYSLSFYKLVKRNFEIEKGSTIMWAGEPLDANLQIGAIYKVETAPLELVSNQITDPALLAQYKHRLPFLVHLNIKGQLFKPEISFKLDMPERDRMAIQGSVYSKIQDVNTRESDLNKQVFALLLLKRFMADNPLDNQSGEGMASTARRSVSKLLTEQLNRLSQNVKGLELSVDVKSSEDYNSSGEAAAQTNLQLGVSKTLLNDRLVVKLSGNVDVEGENTQQSSLTDYIGDLALEYKITPDGRLRITGFRNSDYDMVDGELTKTGAGLIYIKDYNAFRELFKDDPKNDEL